MDQNNTLIFYTCKKGFLSRPYKLSDRGNLVEFIRIRIDLQVDKKRTFILYLFVISAYFSKFSTATNARPESCVFIIETFPITYFNIRVFPVLSVTLVSLQRSSFTTAPKYRDDVDKR